MKKILCVTMFLLVSTCLLPKSIFAKPKEVDLLNDFKTADLRQSLIQYDLNGDDKLSAKECKKVKEYSVQLESKTFDCKKMKNFANLESLVIRGGEYTHKRLKLKNLSELTKLKKLKIVVLAKCNLKKGINVSKYSNLKILRITQSNLPKLSVKKNKKLVELDCESNQLKKLDLSANKKLKKLSCGDNLFKGLNLEKNQKLAVLSLNYGVGFELTNLKLYRKGSVLSKLNIMYLSKMKKMDLSSFDFKCLKELRLDQNFTKGDQWKYGTKDLTELYIGDAPALKELYIDSGNLANLRIDHAENLWRLICADNRLTSLKTSGLPALEVLDISNNQITQLDLRSNKKIKNVSYDNNGMKQVLY